MLWHPLSGERQLAHLHHPPFDTLFIIIFHLSSSSRTLHFSARRRESVRKNVVFLTFEHHIRHFSRAQHTDIPAPPVSSAPPSPPPPWLCAPPPPVSSAPPPPPWLCAPPPPVPATRSSITHLHQRAARPNYRYSTCGRLHQQPRASKQARPNAESLSASKRDHRG